MKHTIEVETIIKELCPKNDGSYTYINLYQKAVMCDTKEKVSDALINQNKDALKFLVSSVKK